MEGGGGGEGVEKSGKFIEEEKKGVMEAKKLANHTRECC